METVIPPEPVSCTGSRRKEAMPVNHETKEILYLKAEEDALPFFQALANKNRLEILRILRQKDASIKELGELLGISSAVITKHIQALEEAGIVRSSTRPGKRGLKKLCTLALNEAQVIFNNNYGDSARSFMEVELPISAYDQCEITAPCGMAGEDRIFGSIDDPRYFTAANRYAVNLLWFTSGWVRYPIPLLDVDLHRVEEIEISMELCSEHPGFNNHWKSDIAFELAGLPLGNWTCPGDFGDRKGRHTPGWWTLGTEYGLLKTLVVNREGTFLDGTQIGAVTAEDVLNTLQDTAQDTLPFRILAPASAVHPGGLNLFGRHFGDYDQNIRVLFYYRMNPADETVRDDEGAEAGSFLAA
ncbi:transcriptional regulator [uncultured Faecalibaculum sp.]|uniref:ArsR/SmtB family transcription factor n=1 Tax=uncultured Faecalibaculum sp. TaxID=1729681 RepID=UPI00271213C6|nr:helix-turn-helix domain-containing protein [uncultured Faecalibaculum sp.]